MPARYPLKLVLSEEGNSLNAALADLEGLAPARHAAKLLEEALRLKRERVSGAEVSAEGKLFNIVRAICSELIRSGWDNDVTLRVFQRIEREHRHIYEEALLGTERPRLNRAIGALVKQCLGVKPELRTNGTVAMGFPKPAETGLIKSYTLLQPSSKATSND